jgi:hypothetical protein
MRLHRKTRALLVAALLLAAANWIGLGSVEREMEQLPSLPALLLDEAQRIELSTSLEKTVLEKIDGEWWVSAPYKAKADQARVKSMVLNLRKEIPMDVLVEHGNLGSYGLDANRGIVVELWTAGASPAVSFTLGEDSAGGSSFLRMSETDAVYRARIGGRHRYDHISSQWRNQVLLDFVPSSAAGIRYTPTTGEGVALERTEMGWEITPSPGWIPDTAKVDALLGRLGRLRIGALAASAKSDPLGTLSISLEDRDLNLQLWPGAQGALLVGMETQDGGMESYLVSSLPFLPLIKGASAFRDLGIFSFNPREELDSIRYLGPLGTVRLQQDLSNGFWNIVEPEHASLDVKEVFYMVNTVSSLQAVQELEEGDPSLLGLDPPSESLVLHMLGGYDQSLLIGRSLPSHGGMHAVSKGSGGRIFLVEASIIGKIRRGFGKEPSSSE